MLFLDGVDLDPNAGRCLRRAKAREPAALDGLVHTLSERIARPLEHRGLRVRDLEGGSLALDPGDPETLDERRGHSTPYRIALGPHAGRKASTLQILPSSGDDERPAARANGFSLHAGVVAAGDERATLERRCRTITRPAVSTERLSLTAQDHLHDRLKTPSREGTTHVVFEPLDKIAGSDFEPPQAGPTGGGQDARNISSPGWRHWCPTRAST